MQRFKFMKSNAKMMGRPFSCLIRSAKHPRIVDWNGQDWDKLNNVCLYRLDDREPCKVQLYMPVSIATAPSVCY